MIRLHPDQMQRIAPIFSKVDETMVLSCLQGYMGSAWADDPVTPACAQIAVADFCFLAGDASAEGAKSLVRNIPPEGYDRDIIFIIPEDSAWCGLFESAHQGRYEKFCRYAIKKEGDVFDRQRLRKIIAKLPPEYSLKRFDEALVHEALMKEWSFSLCSQFDSAADYLRRGRGYGIVHNGVLVSGASSYTFYDGGLEIEIDTDEQYRRQGLALVCGAALVLDCIEHGLYPSWDAANKASVALSEKLGYHFDKEYPAYSMGFMK